VPFQASTRRSNRGRKLSISDRQTLDTLRGLRAHIDQLLTSASYTTDDNVCSVGSYLLPLSRSQSLFLGDLVTTIGERSTWYSVLAKMESWAMCGNLGEASGPQLTVFISAISDKDVTPS